MPHALSIHRANHQAPHTQPPDRTAPPSPPTAGFSLLECLIALAIMAILSTLAIPSYIRFTQRAFYSEIVQATAPYQFGVALCVQSAGELSACHAGSHSVPDAIKNIQNIASLTVKQGIITVTPKKTHGFDKSDTYILTPTLTPLGITWQSSGGAVDKGYAR